MCVIRRRLRPTKKKVRGGLTVDPITDEDTSDDKQLIYTRKTTANGSRGVFCDVERVDHRSETSTESRDEPADVHGGEVTRSSSLKNNADDGDTTSGPDENGSASEPIGSLSGEEGTDETSGLQGRNDVGREVGTGDITHVLEVVEPKESRG